MRKRVKTTFSKSNQPILPTPFYCNANPSQKPNNRATGWVRDRGFNTEDSQTHTHTHTHTHRNTARSNSKY